MNTEPEDDEYGFNERLKETITADPAYDIKLEIIDSHEAALMLGVTVNNLRQMVHKNKIIVQGKSGRRINFKRIDVEMLAITRKGS